MAFVGVIDGIDFEPQNSSIPFDHGIELLHSALPLSEMMNRSKISYFDTIIEQLKKNKE